MRRSSAVCSTTSRCRRRCWKLACSTSSASSAARSSPDGSAQSVRYRSPMATLQVGDATLGYAVDGPEGGVPLLLFHGTTMDRTAWDMVRAAMPSDTYRFVMVEFPGSGESSLPD